MKTISNIKWSDIMKHRNAIYGVSALYVFVFHINLMTRITRFPYLADIIDFGAVGVDVFVFLSGIGWYFSLKADPNIGRFYRKRVLRIIIPYLIIATPYMAWRYLWLEHSFPAFVANLSTFAFWFSKDKTVWYIAFAILSFLLFPYIFNAFESSTNHRMELLFIYIFISFSLCMSMYYYKFVFYNYSEIALTRFVVFLVGAYIANKVYKNEIIGLFWLWIPLITLIIKLALMKCRLNALIYQRYWYCFLGITLVILSGLFFNFCCSKAVINLFSFFGNISLELYLTHILIRAVWLKFEVYKMIHGFLLNAVAIFILSLTISLLIKVGVQLWARKGLPN